MPILLNYDRPKPILLNSDRLEAYPTELRQGAHPTESARLKAWLLKSDNLELVSIGSGIFVLAQFIH